MARQSRPRWFTRREAISLIGTGMGAGCIVRSQESVLAALAQSTAPIRRALPLRKGAIIRTLLKDITPDTLGNGATLFHEHLSAFTSPPREGLPPGAPPVPNLDLLVEELRASAKDGVACIVDSAVGPRTAQRLEDLKTIATRAGLHIAIGGGYYRAPYPADVIQMTEDAIAERLVQDAKVQRWAAFGEIGTNLEVHPDERKMLRAVGKAHLRTDLPIFTHTPHQGCPQCTLDQVDIFESVGVDPRIVCIGHLSDITAEQDPGWGSLKALGKRGVFLGFDTLAQGWTPAAHRVPPYSQVTDATRVKMILAVIEAGYEDQLLFGTDFTDERQLKANWGAGLSIILLDFVPKLRYAGVKENTIRKITVDNPRRFLTFVPKSSS